MTETERSIIIPSGTMINLSGHEDDEAETLVKDVKAFVLGPPVNHALLVRIPERDPDRVFYIHQPESQEA